tara:strand:+ start:311 stop:448 length:138 start_codon:yes stop_codon:yes gene_type:complete
MKGKTLISLIGVFFIFFTGFLFYALFSGGWFDLFLNGGFEALYGD